MGSLRRSTLIAMCAMLGLLCISACDGVLDTQPQSSLDETLLANEEGVQRLLIAAYAGLNGNIGGGSGTAGGWYASEDNWMWGSVGADDAHKGSSPGDQAQITTFELHTVDETSSGVWRFWRARYDGVARANKALSLVKRADDMSEAAKTQVEAEARFLRAHYHFELKRMFNNIPYIVEDMEDTRVPNTEDTWPDIEADFSYAAEHLPPSQSDAGRPTSYAAKAYLAKVHLYQQDYPAAKPLFDEVTMGPYSLTDCYHDSFNAETDNHSGAVFQVQASVNDGSDGSGLGRTGAALNFPYSFGPGKCCGFFQPSVDLVNAFQVDEQTGLPMPDSYGATDFKNDQGLVSTDPFEPDMETPVDPRLDWTVGRRGVPYLDWGLHPGQNAIRQQGFGGPYSPIKNVYYQRHEGTLSTSSGGSAQHNANNYSIIRYADVLLMAAEVEAELGNLDGARGLVNQVRERARDGCKVTHEDGTEAANYHVGLYEQAWSGLDEARDAIRFERRLELGMEGHRWFDLVRWGVAEEVMNDYYANEVEHRSYFSGASLEPHEVYYPIPEQEIRRSAVDGVPVLQQNPGYGG